MKNIKYLLPLLFILLTQSCRDDSIYDKQKKISGGIWNQKEVLKFDVQVDDTLSSYRMFINTRNSTYYNYSNLYIFITINYPGEKISRDTIDCLLADEKGKWLGKGSGGYKDCSYLIKKGIRFNQKGIYSLVLEQAMRVENLEGIESIGIRIEKMK